MKIVLLGCNHAGTWAAKTLLKRKKVEDEVIIFDRNDNISFLGCGIALWVSGVVRDSSTLFYSSPQELEKMGAKVHKRHEIIEIDSKNKVLTVKDLDKKHTFKQTYDKLIVGAGSWPIIPPIPGINAKNVLIAKLYQHAQEIIAKVKDKKIKNVVVIGAGYIGVELAEAFDLHGKNVTFIEMQNRVTPNTFDFEMSQKLHEGIAQNSRINLRLEEKVEEFVADENQNLTHIKTDKGIYEADMAIVAIGFRPNIKLLENQVELSPQGSLIVDEYFRAIEKEDIYGIGDCISQKFNPDQSKKAIMLASNAVRSGILAAMNILEGNKYRSPGIEGSNAIHVFGWTLGGVGLTEEQAKMSKTHKNVESILVEDYDKPVFIDERKKVWFKVVYDRDTKEIIGAQIASQANHAYEIYMLSLALEKKVKIDELGFIDTYFLPHLNNPVSFIAKATYKYLKIID